MTPPVDPTLRPHRRWIHYRTSLSNNLGTVSIRTTMTAFRDKTKDRWWRFQIQLFAPRLEQEKFSDDAIVQFHKRVEWKWPILIFSVSLLASLIPGLGSDVSDSFMPVVAQILPVLFLAQVVESGFHARRLTDEVGKSHAELVWRYVGASAQVSFLVFIAGEGAALFAVAKGANTFCVLFSLLVGILQAADVSFSIRIRGGDQLSLTRLVALQEQHK